MSKSLRPHFLDSSALVKLSMDEPGSEVLRQYFGSHSWFVTSPLCIAEALNVAKRKWAKREVADQQYYDAVWDLLWSYREGNAIQLTNENFGAPEVFARARELSREYRVDLVDALQLYLLSHGALALYCDGSTAVHISADRILTLAARNEGLLAWDCVHEPSPPTSP